MNQQGNSPLVTENERKEQQQKMQPLNARIEDREDGVHVLVVSEKFYDLGKNLGITTATKNGPFTCGTVQGTDKKLFIEPITTDREARV